MADFSIAYAPLKQFEGGYSNDSADSGGETYAGISRRYFPNWDGWATVDACKKRIGANPAILTKKLGAIASLQRQVADWYEKEWWNRLGLSELPQILANEIFEQAVNLGKAGCAKKVQIICNAYNYLGDSPIFPDLVVDGAIGPKTLLALKTIISHNKADPAALVHALNCMQGAHYLELAAKKASQRKFTVGWMSRTHCGW